MKLNLTHNLTQTHWREINLRPTDSLDALKKQISLRTGSDPQDIQLELRDNQEVPIGPLTTSLAAANAKDGYTIHVIDTNPASVLLQIEEPVPKFELSEEQYRSRPDNARAFIEKLRAEHPERFASPPSTTPERISSADLEHLAQERFGVSLESIEKNGCDCSVRCTDVRGTLRWLGQPSLAIVEKYNLSHGQAYGGVVLPDSRGVFNGIDPQSGKMLFDCGGDMRGVFIAIDDLVLGGQPEACADEI